MRLRPEKNARLLAAAHRMGMRGDHSSQERVQLPGADPGLPAQQRQLDRLGEFVYVAPGECRKVDMRSPRPRVEVPFDLAVQVAAAFLVGQVPLVVGDHQRLARLLNLGQNLQVLLGDRFGGIHHHDAAFSPFDRGLSA